MILRAMCIDDMHRVAELCRQLGYPTANEALVARFIAIERRGDHAVLVAEEAGTIIGWMHLCEVLPLEKAAYVEISALVVDEARQRGGVGRRLVHEASVWARTRGIATLGLRSQVHREEAHRFYERLGFVREAQSFFFAKTEVASSEGCAHADIAQKQGR